MEALLILLAIVFFGLVMIGVPVALVRVSSLQRQVDHLRNQLEGRTRVTSPKDEASADTAEERPAPPRARPARPAPERPAPARSAAAEAGQSEDARASAPLRPASADAAPPKAFVFTQERAGALSGWLRENWVLAVAAASLALAGVFMVQYGIEAGLLTPFARVMASLGFGALLIAGGEFLRRRHGDDGAAGDKDVRFLPSALSGAGIIVLFAGVLAARQLYGLIGPTPALAGLCAVALMAILLGWFYGAPLAAIGVIGAGAAPFLVGGSSDAPWLFYYYYALIAVMALGIDTIKRWAWVSVLGLAVGFGGMGLLYLGGAGTLHYAVALFVVVLAALGFPMRSFVPQHGGAMLLSGAVKGWRGAQLPEFPTRLAAGAVLVASGAGLAIVLFDAGVAEVWVGLGLLLLLIGALTLWAEKAPALADLTALPALGMLVGITMHGLDGGALVGETLRSLSVDPEITPPDTWRIYYALVGIGALVSVMMFWRMSCAAVEGLEKPALGWALGAAVFGPAMFLTLEFTWPAARVLGAYPWALAAIALAALMTLLAERAARYGEGDARLLRTALFAIGALTLIAMALFLVLTKAALSLALAAMIVAIVLIDRRFNMPLLGLFVQLGVAVISYRMVIDPGIYWASERATSIDAFASYAGVIALLGAAWALAPDSAERGLRKASKLAIESAIALVALAGAAVLLIRLFGDDLGTHWGFGLLALIAGASALVQVHRLGGTDWRSMRWVRYGLIAVFSLISLMFLAAQATLGNPLFGGFFSNNTVRGPLFADTLAVAYLPLASLFGFAAKRYARKAWLRGVLYGLSGLYAATYVVFEVRRLFHGRDLSDPNVTDGELYAYTVVMLVASVALLLFAYKRRSLPLRKLAMAGVALTIAKVFLVDMSGLAGLIRVVSFMGLGLSLLALVWLNRKLDEGWEQRAAPDLPESADDEDGASPSED